MERSFPPASMVRFYTHLVEIEWDILPVPSVEELPEYAALIDPKDLHVLAAAAVGASEFLLTLRSRNLFPQDCQMPNRQTIGDHCPQVRTNTSATRGDD